MRDTPRRQARNARSARAAVTAGAALVGLAVLAAAGDAAAFCRTSACPVDGKTVTSKVCTPAEGDDCGIPIFWPTNCVSFSLQKDASTQVSFDVAEDIFEKAFDTWMNALCPGGGKPHIKVVNLGPVECAEHEYSQTDAAGNANIMMFRDNEWPHPGAGSTLALTTVTYNTKSGEIYDADMEINSADTVLTTSDTAVQFDLLSIVTHETGHFLGLSHSTVAGATMMAEYKPGTIDLRDLSDDDVMAICAVYPPGDPIPDTCNATPRHGFASKCDDGVVDEEANGCCMIAAGLEPSEASKPGNASDAGSAGSAINATQRAPLGRSGLALCAVGLLGLAIAARRRAAGRG